MSVRDAKFFSERKPQFCLDCQTELTGVTEASAHYGFFFFFCVSVTKTTGKNSFRTQIK